MINKERVQRPPLHRNLVDALLMAPALELGGEVFVHNFASHSLVNEAPRHYEHVGVVVLSNQMGNLWNPAKSGTNALMLVQRHVDSLAAAADGYARKNLASFNATRQGMTEVAIVARLLAVRAIVLVLVSLLLKILLNELLQCKASMVAGQSNCSNFHIS